MRVRISFKPASSSIAPVITLQPVRQEVTAGAGGDIQRDRGGSATLLPMAEERDGHLRGDIVHVYSLAAGSDDGTVFTVVVSNAVGSVTSSPAILSVNAAAGQLTLSSHRPEFWNGKCRDG